MKTPFDLLYEQLVQELVAPPETVEKVRKRNLISFQQEASPEKKALQTVDLPEVVIYMTGLRGNIHASSSTASITTEWQYMVTVGHYDSSVLYAFVFAAVRALAKKQHFMQLQWNNRVFVKDMRLSNTQLGLSNGELNRNINGWACVFNFEIDVSLLLKDLADYGT